MVEQIPRELHARYHELDAGELGALLQDQGLNTFTKVEVLANALATNLKEVAREHYRAVMLNEARGLTSVAVEMAGELQRLNSLGLDRKATDAMPVLPVYSLALAFTFRLERPYLSRDDDAFYIIDNPVRKEKIFKLPMVAPTSWKGSLPRPRPRRYSTS